MSDNLFYLCLGTLLILFIGACAWGFWQLVREIWGLK